MEVGKLNNFVETKVGLWLVAFLGNEYTYQQFEVAAITTGGTEAGFAGSRS